MKTNGMAPWNIMPLGVQKEGCMLKLEARKFGIIMPGDWMNDPKDPENSIFQGDLLVIDIDEAVTDADVVFVCVSKQYYTVRRWYVLNDHEVKLVADNPMVEPLIKKKKDVEIVGKVVGYSHSMERRKDEKGV